MSTLSSNIVFFTILVIGFVMIAYGLVFKQHITVFTTVGIVLVGIGTIWILASELHPTLLKMLYNNMDNNPPIINTIP